MQTITPFLWFDDNAEEAISFAILCDTQQEVDELWEKLSSGGG